MAFIYGLYDAAGRLLYIGKANDPAKRLASHLRDARRRRSPLYSWIAKHGAPEIRVLESDCADWRESERRLIAEARERGEAHLNLADGGDEPHCPPAVRAANGRRVAATRNPIVHGLLCDLGRSGSTAPRVLEAMAVLRAMTPEQQAVFAAKWAAR